MKKKAKKSKASVRKPARRRTTARKKKETHPAEVRKEISLMVEAGATQMAKAVMGEGIKGELAPVKYLFEVAGIFPKPEDGSESTEHEDSLAETLLKRFNIPIKPISQDEEKDDEDVVVIPARVAVVEEKPSEDVVVEEGEDVVVGV